jgi:hypothetical protein
MNWNWTSRYALCAGILLCFVGLWYLDNLRVSEAEARAERAEETARRVNELEAELAWRRLDDAVLALEPAMDDSRRREAVNELRKEIQRLKNHVKLRALDGAR